MCACDGIEALSYLILDHIVLVNQNLPLGIKYSPDGYSVLSAIASGKE